MKHARQALDAYTSRLTAQATSAFERHAIRSRSDGRWLLMRPDGAGWTGVYAAEVIVLWGGQLLVHGDIDHVIFAHYSDSREPERVLRWMGDCTDVEYYVRQKARIGTGRELVDDLDRLVCEAGLQDELDLLDEEGCGGEEEARVRMALRGALIDLGDGADVRETIDGLYRYGVDPETLVRLGEVTAPRVYFAHAALRRLCKLLDEERKAETTGQDCQGGTSLDSATKETP